MARSRSSINNITVSQFHCVTTEDSVKVLVAQSCPTVCDSMDWSPPGSSVRGIFQARILERVAISFSRGYSRPRDRDPGLWRCREILYCLATREAHH